MERRGGCCISSAGYSIRRPELPASHAASAPVERFVRDTVPASGVSASVRLSWPCHTDRERLLIQQRRSTRSAGSTGCCRSLTQPAEHYRLDSKFTAAPVQQGRLVNGEATQDVTSPQVTNCSLFTTSVKPVIIVVNQWLGFVLVIAAFRGYHFSPIPMRQKLNYNRSGATR